ncbi:MFS transporter [Sphingobacterium cellulitidis]|uniref:MFS transporter n=1 Tax=Sphingobacterium cellulitidis TaxID=1768011 RepID=UPI000B944E2A|nr:MFS transporter [Sphingobacterium cellulitidis]OYD47008.1 MFS transporter [Sphingobacterium cellulitidis]
MNTSKPTKYRWTICALIFFATTINYLDRQVLSLTWKDFIAPEFHWTNNDYGNVAAIFSIVYAISMLLSGRFIDKLGTKKGYLWAIAIWSVGAILHAFCGMITSGVLAGEWLVSFGRAKEVIAGIEDVSKVVNISVTVFIFARIILALGEGGNFPAAMKACVEYFPKKDRAFSTSIFNSGTTIGALLAPLIIPVIAAKYGWEMSFIIIGALGFIWMGFWQFMYKKPEENPNVNAAELAYIKQDVDHGEVNEDGFVQVKSKVSVRECLKYKQTWALIFGKFLTDGVWWFLLFWFPAYLSSVYDIKSSDIEGQVAIFVLYAITMLSIIGGWLPTYFVEKKGMEVYAGRMRAMLIFAFFPLLILFAQPLGEYSYWFPVILIGISAAAHQSWSANIFSAVGDMFPKKAIATVTGISGLAGGVGSFLINKISGVLFDYAEQTNMKVFGFEGIESGYFIIFAACSVAYLLAWVIMRSLVPKMKLIHL